MYLPFMLLLLLVPLALIYWRRVLSLPASLTRSDIVAAGVFLQAMVMLIFPYVYCKMASNRFRCERSISMRFGCRPSSC